MLLSGKYASSLVMFLTPSEIRFVLYNIQEEYILKNNEDIQDILCPECVRYSSVSDPVDQWRCPVMSVCQPVMCYRAIRLFS